jgi:hypothetical protein
MTVTDGPNATSQKIYNCQDSNPGFRIHIYKRLLNFGVLQQNARGYPKYSGLVPPSRQQLWLREAPVDGRTTASSESVCQFARSWVDVVSFHTHLVVSFMTFRVSPEYFRYPLVKENLIPTNYATQTMKKRHYWQVDSHLRHSRHFPHLIETAHSVPFDIHVTVHRTHCVRYRTS